MNSEAYYLVTGASSGIGKKVTLDLLKKNKKVVAVSRDKTKLNNAFEKNKNLITIPFDLSQIDKLDDLAISVNNKVGKIKGIFFSHGIYKLFPVHMLKEKDINETFLINTLSVIRLVSIFSKKDYFENGASFLLMSSLASRLSNKGASLYSASKASLESFVKSLKGELKEKGIKINALAPGIIRTKMNDVLFDNLSIEQKKKIKKDYPNGFLKIEKISKLIIKILNSNKTGHIYVLRNEDDIKKVDLSLK